LASRHLLDSAFVAIGFREIPSVKMIPNLTVPLRVNAESQTTYQVSISKDDGITNNLPSKYF
jgi:hypothetical protein